MGRSARGQPVLTVAFHIATSVDDAVERMAEGARPIAGGTDLVVAVRQGRSSLPEQLVAVHRLDELAGIDRTGGGLRLGALATHARLAADTLVCSGMTALADASAIIGSPATRARGTLGGNLMNASPAMETAGPAICFDATVILRSADGVRRVPLSELFLGPGRTCAGPGELLVWVDVPPPPPRAGSCYLRLEYRRSMEVAVVGVTAMIALAEDLSVVDARVAITALAPTVRRVPAAEQALLGSDGGEAALAAASAATAEAATPITDGRASAEYRRAAAAVIARRAVEVAVRRARGEAVGIPATAWIREHGTAR